MSIIRSTLRRALVLSSLLLLAMLGFLSTGTLASAGASPAANGDPVILGGGNDETVPTSVTNTQSDWAFAGIATAYPNGTGLIGTGSGTGVVGNGTGEAKSIGVSGTSSS